MAFWVRGFAPSAHYMGMRRLLLLAALAAPLLAQAPAEYVGGTAAILTAGAPGAIDISDDQYLAFYSSRARLRVPYARVNLIEYGQQVDRRLTMAVVISPIFLLSKSRKHFLTLGFSDEDGKQQALVFRVDKNSIRPTLASLEARTGLRVQFQDQEARKAGHS